MTNWKNCKNILCIRADNMGDVIMSSPAFRALKETFNCKITLLTSKMGSLIVPFIKEIDETIVADLPWIKTENPVDQTAFVALVKTIQTYHFDAAIIFTVYSQNPLPAAMLAYMAQIAKRLAYCRENPYHLLSDWAVEKEPYDYIQHQVTRDLNLVKTVGAETDNEELSISFRKEASASALKKLADAGVDTSKPWLILHPGVSEKKREYPVEKWIETARLLRDRLSFQLVITGSGSERETGDEIQKAIGQSAFCLCGLLTMEEFIALISHAPVVISVNTATVHIASATHTPVVVLYALTNPQHTPWKTRSSTLYFSVQEELKSKNEVVNYVTEHIMSKTTGFPSPETVFTETKRLLAGL
jgi:lipopolysaccharide heptosyltransferase II